MNAFRPLCMLAAVPWMLWAQPDLEQAEEAVELAPFAVEAYSLPFSVESFPGSTEVMTEARWKGLGVQCLSEVLATEANVTMRSFSGNASSAEVDLRGYGENSGLRTLILVDGQPLNRADMGAPSWLEVPLSRIAQVEILRGPQTARFGNHAVGGVINIITRLDRADEPVTELEVGAGSYESYWSRIHHSRSLGPGAVSVAAESTTTDGYRVNSGYEASSASLNYAQTWQGGVTLRTGAFFLADEVEFPGPASSSGAGFPDDPQSSVYGDSPVDYFGNTRKIDVFMALLVPFSMEGHRLEVRSGLGGRDVQWNFGTGSHANNRQLTWRLTPEWSWEGADDARLGVGVSAHGAHVEFDLFKEIDRINLVSEAELDSASLSVFAYGEKPFATDWTLLGAVRFEENSLSGRLNNIKRPTDPRQNFDRERTSGGWAAQLGINWQPVEGWRGWLRYDRLYRFPVIDEIASFQGMANDTPFNDKLDPEVGDNLECGFEWQGKKGGISANGFIQRLLGEIAYIDYVYDDGKLNNLNVNLDDTRRLGVELSAHVLFGGWKGQIAYTRLSATFTEGEDAGRFIPLVSPHSLSASVDTPAWAGLRLRAEALYRHRMYEGNDDHNIEPPLPGWTVVNLSLRWKATRQLSAFFRLNNLFDRDYAALKYSGSWYPDPGRNVRIGFNLSL